MKVLVAFDKFKDALSAPEACARVAAELRRRGLAAEECPVADGGEGFASILTQRAAGAEARITATGPRGDPVEAAIGLVAWERVPPAARATLGLGGVELRTVALVEMATASGLALLPPERRDPWRCTTIGTGELLRAAAVRGAGGIVLGIGGSATNDLGLGALQALGWRFLTSGGEEIQPPTPDRWKALARMEGSRPVGLPPIRVACDVSNPLLGAQGATAVYGPQKGLRPADRDRMEEAVARAAALLCAHAGRPSNLVETPGAGAAGGLGFGLMAALDARFVAGSALIADWLELDRHVAEADLVITGEGRFDESSFAGKGPGGVIARAVALGKPVHVLAGAVAVGEGRLPPAVRCRAITPEGMPIARALRETAERLVLCAAELAEKLNAA